MSAAQRSNRPQIDVTANGFDLAVAKACAALAGHPNVYQFNGKLFQSVPNSNTGDAMSSGYVCRRMRRAALMPILASLAVFAEPREERLSATPPYAPFAASLHTLESVASAVLASGAWPGVPKLPTTDKLRDLARERLGAAGAP